METNSNNTKTSTITKMDAVKKKIEKLNNDCSWLEQKIKCDEDTLKQSISEISTSCPIKTTEYWIKWFDHTDVNGTFIAVYNDIVKFKNATVQAFRDGFYNSTEILSLLRKVADYELDLYRIIDESELTSAELSEMLTVALNDSNTTDDVVVQLLEQAKQRAIRLKERFESFRNEFENELKESSSKANNRIDKLKSETENSIGDLNKRIGDQGVSIHNLKERLKKMSTMSDDKNKRTKKWVVLGFVLTFVFSLVGSFLIHHFL